MRQPNKVLITAALPYANGPLHFGHIAGCYLPADCYARFLRLKGEEVLYICGSDEYGVAITLSAELAGRTPKEHVDFFHRLNERIFEQLNVSFDHYSRTTWEGHVETVQQYFLDLLKNGHIEERETEQLYSEAEGRFLADRYVTGSCPKCGFKEARGDECPSCGGSFEATDLKEPRSKLTGSALTLRRTKHWFVRFDHFKENLRHFLAQKNWKSNVSHFAAHYIDELHPRAITRDSTWGVPIPLEGTEGKVFYVWFDAPIGYISATREWAITQGQSDKWKEYWCNPDCRLVHFIGKDNIPFHAVFFPAMTMGQDQPYKLVDDLPANEFYTLEGRQFSKSSGWFIDVEEFFKEFSADQIRYVIAANAPETQDSEFTWLDFQARCNSELVGKFGNLVNRVLTFAASKCEGKIPPCGPLTAPDEKFLADMKALINEIAFAYEGYKLRKASQLLMELCTLGNVYFDAKKPWATAKDPATFSETETTIYCSLQLLRALALVSSPIVPATADKLWSLLGEEEPLKKEHWEEAFFAKGFEAGRELPIAEVLFTRVEDEVIEQQLQKLKGIVPAKPLKEAISYEEFSKVDLRVARILKAERVEKSQKLLKLEVDIGFEKRTVVSGIALDFPKPEELVGKNVVLVANMKSAKLMGIKSEGMILAAGLKEGLELPSLQHAQPGDQIS
jgi:methionyl-tRNA synthetase